jgi:hypothetical protein
MDVEERALHAEPGAIGQQLHRRDGRDELMAEGV